MNTVRQTLPVTIVTGTNAAEWARRLAGAAAGVVSPGDSSETVSRTPGCACCAMRLDLIAMVRRAVTHKTPPSRLVVVAQPTDDVVTFVYTLMSDADLGRWCHLDGVVALVDGPGLSVRLATSSPLGTHEELDALAIADRIMVVDGDALTVDGKQRVYGSLRCLNRTADVLPAPLNRERVVASPWVHRVHAWCGVPMVKGKAMTLSPDDDRAPSTIVLRHNRALDADATEEWLHDVVTRHSSRLLRLQGAFTIAGAGELICCHAVRSFARNHPAPRQDDINTHASSSAILIVGRGLDIAELSNDFDDVCRR